MRSIVHARATVRRQALIAVAAIALSGGTFAVRPHDARADQPVPIQSAQNDTQTQNPPPPGAGPRPMPPPPGGMMMRQQSIDDRIKNLHDALQITPQEEEKWNVVAQTMRDNMANAMKMIQEGRAKMQQPNASPLAELQTYQAFMQTQADGLEKLLVALTALYDSMPDQQKKVADQALRRMSRGPAGHGF